MYDLLNILGNQSQENKYDPLGILPSSTVEETGPKVIENNGLLKTAKALKNVFYTSPGRGFGEILEGLAAEQRKTPPQADKMSYWGKAQILNEIKNRGMQIPQYVLDDPELTNKVIDEYLWQKSERLSTEVAPKLETFAKAYPEPEPTFTEGVPGFLEQAGTGMTRYGASMATGPLGLAPIYLQEKGRKYNEYKAKGYDDQTAQDASDIHALTAAPVELAGNLFELGAAGKALNTLGKKLGIGEKALIIIGQLGKSGIAESSEEGIQSLTEALADVYAKEPKAPAKKIVKDVIKVYKSPEFRKSTAMQMAAGFVGGVALPGTSIAAGAPMEMAGVGERERIEKPGPSPTETVDNALLLELEDQILSGKLSDEETESVKIDLPHLAEDIDTIASKRTEKETKVEEKSEEKPESQQVEPAKEEAKKPEEYTRRLAEITREIVGPKEETKFETDEEYEAQIEKTKQELIKAGKRAKERDYLLPEQRRPTRVESKPEVTPEIKEEEKPSKTVRVGKEISKSAKKSAKGKIGLKQQLGQEEKAGEKTTIPDFNPEEDVTLQSYEFSKIATPEQIEEARQLAKQYDEENAQAVKAKKFKKAMDLTMKSQYYREIYEAKEDPERFEEKLGIKTEAETPKAEKAKEPGGSETKYSPEQLKSVTVKVEAIRAKTGEKIIIEDNAFDAMNENSAKRDLYKELLDCLKR